MLTCAACFAPAETTVKQIEDTFKDFTTREDIAIVLIVQFVSPLPLQLCDHRVNRCHCVGRHSALWCLVCLRLLSSLTLCWQNLQVADLIRHKVDAFKEVLCFLSRLFPML